MKNQPVLFVPKSPLERRLEIAVYVLIVLHFTLAFYSYPNLPARIPVHFNAAGDVDHFAGRAAIFQLPVISLVLSVALAFLSRFPHKFNYLRPITPENAALEYARARTMLWIVNLLAVILLLLLSGHTIRAAYGGSLVHAVWIVVAMLVVAPWIVLNRRKTKPIEVDKGL